jgi:hypothetical protein
MPTYAIVVSSATKAIRRVIAADGNGNVGVAPNAISVTVAQPNGATSHLPITAGEQILIVTVAGAAHGPSDWVAQVQAITGVAPPNPTMALVDGTNTVQHVICGEAALDAANVTGFTAVDCYSPQITVGCTYDPNTTLFTAPAFTIPAGAAGNRGSALPKNVAAIVIPRP